MILDTMMHCNKKREMSLDKIVITKVQLRFGKFLIANNTYLFNEAVPFNPIPKYAPSERKAL